MSEIAERFVYRESVRTYFRSAEVRFPVQQLLARKTKYVPQTFSRDEVADFYKACLAARQTQIDYALDMFDLWHCIWPDLGPGWQPVPYDPADDELTLDAQVRWDLEYFQRNFELREKHTTVSMWLFLSSKSPNASEISLGCSLRMGKRSLFGTGNIPNGWSWDKETEAFEFSFDADGADDGFDLTLLIMAAQRAVHLIEILVR